MTDGLSLAERQLKEIAALSDGSVEVLETEDTATGRWFTISMDTSGVPTRGAGIRVRGRERFCIFVGSRYPHQPPTVRVPHRRWAKTAHVQWGNQLCLYAAASVEWVPSDGMNGFMERLSAWVVRAAEGTLDPDGQPLHPPVAYATAGVGTVVVHPDVGDRAPWERGDGTLPDESGLPQVASMVGWCTVHGDRVDVLEWVDWETVCDKVLADDFAPFQSGSPLVVMPALLISDELGFEYPEKAWDLVTALDGAGFSLDDILDELGNALVINRELRARQLEVDPDAAGQPIGFDPDGEESPAVLLTGLLVGSPSRRVDEEPLAHLAAWCLGGAGRLLAEAYVEHRRKPGREEIVEKVGEIARSWLQKANAEWMRVLENRPEITHRRDQGTPSTWLAGKRVLILGCGALGAPLAEHCTRAGVATLHVLDNGLVTPGILVRQPYNDSDIGRPKAEVLAGRLSQVRADLKVEGIYGNALDVLLQPSSAMSSYDVVMDATADVGVRAAIESRRRSDIVPWPTVVTMIIGHDATRGLVTVSTPAATGAGASALRKVALHAFANPGEWADISDDFFPADPRTEMFFPEPGCSAPTFVGGSTQTTALAGSLLNDALLALGEHAVSDVAPGATTFASAIRIGAAATDHGTSRVRWGPDTVVADDTLHYEVRLSSAAVTEMRTEVRRGARVRGRRIETGGMLLGTVDDAAGVVYVDRVTGPPPDSFLSATYFQHGQEGAQDAIDAHRENSRSMAGFVGYWHTHPEGRAAPSPTDEEGMASIVTPDGRRQRALMVIVGGRGQDWARWVDEDGPVPMLFARLVPRGEEPADSGSDGVFVTQQLPDERFFRGGFSPPAAVTLSGSETGSATVSRSRARIKWWPRHRGEHR